MRLPQRTRRSCWHSSDHPGSVQGTHGITKGRVTVGLDCEGALKAIQAKHPPKVTTPHWDMINECRALLSEMPVSVRFKWVKGHQDRIKSGERLDWWARQNIRMDQAAKRHWNKHRRGQPQELPLAHDSFPITVRGKKLSNFNKETVWELYHNTKIKEYWEDKDNLNPEKYKQVNWQASKTAQKETSRAMRRFQAKFATRFIGCGRMMKLRHHWSHSKCPLCGHEEETTMHVLQCQDSRAKEVWDKSMEALEEWMTSQHTEPELQRLFLANLNQHQRERRYWTPAGVPAEVARAIDAQSRLGWHNAMLGRLHPRLEQVQQASYSRANRKKTGRRWSVMLIKKLREITWKMWHHRNSILHHTKDNHHTRTLDAEANTNIDHQFKIGTRRIRPRDRRLFRNKTKVMAYSLTDKLRWLDRVEGARKVWAVDRANEPDFRHERQGIATFTGRPELVNPPPAKPPPEPPPPEAQPRRKRVQQQLTTRLGLTAANPSSDSDPKPKPKKHRKPKRKYTQEKLGMGSWVIRTGKPGAKKPKRINHA